MHIIFGDGLLFFNIIVEKIKLWSPEIPSGYVPTKLTKSFLVATMRSINVLDDGVPPVGSWTMFYNLRASKIWSSLTEVGSHLVVDISFSSQRKSPKKIMLDVLHQVFSKGELIRSKNFLPFGGEDICPIYLQSKRVGKFMRLQLRDPYASKADGSWERYKGCTTANSINVLILLMMLYPNISNEMGNTLEKGNHITM